MNSFVAVAKKAIENYVNNGQIISPGPTNNHPRAGCFVSIHKKNGELRGCIGTILPTCDNLSSEIINNAISACQDPRFEPVKKEELDDLNISVDVLSEPEPITSPKSLNPKKYGVIVKSRDGRRGLLLPDLEGVDSPDYQISIAKDKAGILPKEPVQLYRFTVKRYKEH